MASDRIQRRIDRLLDQVEQEADNQNWEQVQTLATEVLAFDPANTDAMSFITAARRVLGVGTDAPEADREPASSTQPSESSSAQPASFSDGRYQVQRFLGEGGKKMVYLAKDTLLDRDVAFALIKTEGLDDVSRSRISREAQAMGRLGSHPHIVTVFDLGEHEGQPFMVVELLGGGDVEGVLEDAEGGRLSLDQAISIAIETCRGLEFAHSRGIVHRDLKPGNVWLTEDGVAKIGDFGLAVSLDRSRLTAEGMMVGTVSYMPPEQAMGGEVTSRADLYSLGAMLYEMVCGRPPFLGDDNIAIIGQHINTPPVAPTWHRSDCPRPLEALIMRLLAKDPSERPDSASDVLAALEAVDVSGSEQSITEPEVAINVLDSLAGDVFVGRQREMGDLKAALEDALSGRGRMVTLVGEPGIGKTRTATELATYAGLRGAQVLWGRCYEEQGVPPYWPWVQAIRSYVRDRDPEELSSEMGSGAGAIAEIVSDVRDRLPGLPKPPPIDDPESARFRLFDSISAFLKSASQSQPLMMVLDDLHWSDLPSLMLLRFISREISGARLLLVGTYRDVELNRQHPLAETLGELTRERLFERVVLRGLSFDDVSRFIRVASEIDPPRSLVQAVHSQTEGNPLFVTEVVRLLVQEGELTSRNARDRESWEIRVPEGVREVLGRRLNRLSQRCNETLTIASVIGREFTLEQLDSLTEDLNQDMLLDVLEEGLTARVIEELPTMVGLYQFTHALIQETLTDELSLTRRVRVHARIAEALEALYQDNLESRAAELAHHFAQAETVHGPEKLVQYSIMAGEKAASNFAYEEAVAQFDRALAAKQGQAIDEESAAILTGLARAQAAMANLVDAASNMALAFNYYIDNKQSNRAVAVVDLSHSARLARLTIDLLARATELVQPESLQAGRIYSAHGFALGLSMRSDESAMEALDKALAIARQENDESLEILTLANAANVHGYHWHLQECLDKSMQALELAERIDHPVAELRARHWAIGSYTSMGDPKAASEQAKRMLKLAERTQDRLWIMQATRNIGLLSCAVGDWESAHAALDQSVSTVWTGFHPQALVNLVQLEYESGNFLEGEPILDTLLETMWEDLPVREVVGSLLTIVARITTDFKWLKIAAEAIEPVLASTDSVRDIVKSGV